MLDEGWPLLNDDVQVRRVTGGFVQNAQHDLVDHGVLVVQPRHQYPNPPVEGLHSAPHDGPQDADGVQPEARGRRFLDVRLYERLGLRLRVVEVAQDDSAQVVELLVLRQGREEVEHLQISQQFLSGLGAPHPAKDCEVLPRHVPVNSFPVEDHAGRRRLDAVLALRLHVLDGYTELLGNLLEDLTPSIVLQKRDALLVLQQDLVKAAGTIHVHDALRLPNEMSEETLLIRATPEVTAESLDKLALAQGL
mmetsp:Transcript_23402/g.44023  ORF Transcript_23402/g.44023 Transcript_23402/m.44023 type:complete len:250 (-) Transcript_23402:185-934(-)